jgi:hypothetical protein
MLFNNPKVIIEDVLYTLLKLHQNFVRKCFYTMYKRDILCISSRLYVLGFKIAGDHFMI